MHAAVATPYLRKYEEMKRRAMGRLDEGRALDSDDWTLISGMLGDNAMDTVAESGIPPAKLIARAGEAPERGKVAQTLAPYRRAAAAGIDYDMGPADIVSRVSENLGDLGRLQAVQVRSWQKALRDGKTIDPTSMSMRLVAWTNKFERRGETETAMRFAGLAAPAAAATAAERQAAREERRSRAKSGQER